MRVRRIRLDQKRSDWERSDQVDGHGPRRCAGCGALSRDRYYCGACLRWKAERALMRRRRPPVLKRQTALADADALVV